MQGQRSSIDSFPETLELDHGSSSSGPGIDSQISWNNMLNPVENRIPDCLLPPHDADFTFPSVSHDGRSLSGWCLGETSSTENTGNQVARDEAKLEHGWPSSLDIASGSGPRLNERQFEPNNLLSLESVNLNLSSNQATSGPLFMQNFSSAIPQNMNDGYSGINGARVVEGGVCPPRLCKPGGSETDHILYSGSSSYAPGTSSRNVGFLSEENDVRPGCSLDGRRLACKRKTLEGASGQLSLGGSSSFFQQAENSSLQPVPASYNVASSSGVATSADNTLHPPNPRLGIDISLGSSSHPTLSTAGGAEHSQRSFRMRTNPAHRDSSPNLLSVGSSSRRSHSHQSASRLLSFNHSLEARPATASTSTASPSHALNTPGMLRTVHPAPRYSSSSARVGNPSSSLAIPGERTASREDSNSRSIHRNISDHPMFVPSAETRNLLQDPNWSLASGSTRVPRNVSSTSRAGSSSGVHPSAAPAWLPLQNPQAQHSRRLSEVVRRSLFPPGSEIGGQSRNLHQIHSGLPAGSQEIHPPGAGHLGHHQPYQRPALRMDRQGDGVLGVPLSFRGLAAAREGRSRLVSEIRNALDFMRRGGEGVRFEDVFVLDQSIFYGMGELQDRHRDMRLDVDNMSYEELLALEERIGNVSTGLSEETITKCLKQRQYMTFTLGVADSDVEPCCICQEEYVDGDNLGRLDCGHDFHSGCIKEWLTQKNLCPICKTTALVNS
ncbi:RING-type E3 ubiquitin transferase [Ranunculus cassubicifolius]